MSVTCSGKPVNSLVLLLFLWLHAALVSGVPTYPDGELHHSKWGKIVSRTVGFVAGAVNTPFPGVKRPDPFTFLVIGANTGSNSNDPLWTAMHHKREKTFQVFVEPIPFIFKELQANMKANDMHQSTCVNAVISTNGQNLTLYCTGMKEDGSIAVEAGFNEWAKQTCSVSKQQLYDSKFSSREMIDKYMREYNVKGLSVQQLVDTYATNAPVKIVQIDVEGLDDEALPLSTISPMLVIFEYIHLTSDKFAKTLKYLHRYGYHTTMFGQNAVAYKQEILEHVPVQFRAGYTNPV